MENFTPVLSTVGGMLIGLAAIMLLYFNGRIAGLSGIIAGVLNPKKFDSLWRVVFVAGLVAGAFISRLIWPGLYAINVDVSHAGVLLAGLLVGLGTRVSNGCTSGHGVCGVGRLAPRSLVASLVFFTTAIATSYVVRHVAQGI